MHNMIVNGNSSSRLLLATDDAAWLGSASHSLSAYGFLVRTALNGQTALDCLFSERFEFLIAATAMPKLDGYKLASEVRRSHFLRNLPVLLVGYDEGAAALEKAVNAGADDYLELPVNNELLRLKVQIVLNRSTRMDVLSEASLIGRFNPRQFSDIVQLLNTTNRTGLLRIISGPSVTQIWFRKGVMSFARDEMDEGVQSIYNLVKATGARFEFIEGEQLRAENIQRSQMFMLLEFSRKLDTYTVSRKQTIKSELDGHKSAFSALIEKGAQKYIPYAVGKCETMIANGEKMLEDENIEEASLIVRKVEDSIKWIGNELERVKSVIEGMPTPAQNRRSARQAANKPAASASQPPATAPDAAQTPSTETQSQSAVEPQAPAWQPEPSQTPSVVPEVAQPAQEPQGKQEIETPSYADADETVTIPVSKIEEPVSETLAQGHEVDVRQFQYNEQPKSQPEPEIEIEQKANEPEIDEEELFDDDPVNDVPKFVIQEEVEEDDKVEEKKPESAVVEKAEEPKAPRLIQRFPPDVVEMMQVELAKISGMILTPEAREEFASRLQNSPVAREMALSKAGRILSEAFYSRANVLCIIVLGNVHDLSDYFSNLTGATVSLTNNDNCLLTRLAGDIENTLYVIGMTYDEMDSFEAENILDRAMGAVIIGLPDPSLEDLEIDALSLALVKFRRHRVAVLYREGTLSWKVGTALGKYGIDETKKRTDFDFTKQGVSGALIGVLDSFLS